MKSVLTLWSLHFVAYVVAFAFLVTDRVSKTDFYAITTTTTLVAAVILSTWLLSEQAKAAKMSKSLAAIAPHVRSVGTVVNLPPSRLYEEEKRKIDAEYDLMVEVAQYAGTD